MKPTPRLMCLLIAGNCSKYGWKYSGLTLETLKFLYEDLKVHFSLAPV